MPDPEHLPTDDGEAGSGRDRHHAAELQAVYRNRFGDVDRQRINAVWDLLIERELGRYVPRDGTVLDLGAGSCVFINRVWGRRRIAVDLNPDVADAAAPGVETLQTRSDDLCSLADGTVDLVFSSNFFEHLGSRAELLATLAECARVTVGGGRIVVLMPNLRAVGARYFDYLDHTLPLTDRSLVEALSLVGYRAERVVPRFIPYGGNPAGSVPSATVGRGVLGHPEIHRRLFAAYLRARPLWPLLGGQMLVVAVKA